jgi:hypothetical protein
MKKTGSDHDSAAKPLERVRLQADVAKQRVRIAKDELKRARKRLKEAKREAKRARKVAAAARKAWKRARRAQKNVPTKAAVTGKAGSRAVGAKRSSRARPVTPVRKARRRRRTRARRRAMRRVRRVVARRVVARRVIAQRVRRAALSGGRRRLPVPRGPSATARSARAAHPAVSAKPVFRRRLRVRASGGRAAGIAKTPAAARVTGAPVPMPEATPALDSTTVTATPSDRAP